MAKRGRRVTFHGAFGSKAAARVKERAVGGFIQERTIRGARRYVVMTEPARPNARSEFDLGAHEDGSWNGLLILGLVAGGLWLLGRRGAAAAALPASTVWISDPAQGGTGEYLQSSAAPGPTPPWREASQYELEGAVP